MPSTDSILMRRNCEVIEIPSGIHGHLDAGTHVRAEQIQHGGYLITKNNGLRYRVEERDADALGLQARTGEDSPSIEALGEEQILEHLKTVFDPEIPVNIVDLGLIYAVKITSLDGNDKKVEIKMTMTSPGCGMANVLKMDVESQTLQLPMVKEVNVEVVFDPPWNPGMMSEEAKLELGFDLDYGLTPSSTSAFRILR